MNEKAKEIINDFELQAVPENERKSFLSITMVWTGFVFVISSMLAGGGLAAGLTMKEIIITTIIGNLFLSIVAILISTISCKTGLTFALLTRYSFGRKGSRVASFFVPIVNIGWYTIQAAVYGHLVAQILHLNALGENIAMMISALVMGVFAIIGIQALTVLGFVAIPAIIFLCIATAMKATGVAGGFNAVMAIVPENPMSISSALTIVIGTWIFAASTCNADFMRYAKNVKEAALSSFVGLVVGNTLLITCGAITAFAMNDSDLTNVLLKMGLVIPSFILMTTNIFTTNGGNIYSTGLNLANALNIEKKKAIIMILIISALLTLTRPYQIRPLFGFLGTLGNLVPPLPGIMFADYYILNKGKYKRLDDANTVNWNLKAWVAWILSVILVFTVKVGFAPINGIILGVVIYTVLMKFGDNKQNLLVEN
ncbi:cytosine permease [Clostridium sediminicola]|uniref:cytosine permease n=1 Tax=Clostridium sediminicola TaxID=3114879 RepID=UPI0031F22739